MTKILELKNQRLNVSLVPEMGGSVAAFWREGDAGQAEHIFRPASKETLAKKDILGVGSFPLDYSNRIQVPFIFRGEEVMLPQNLPFVRWPLHGRSWQKPWDVTLEAETSATLSYTHGAGVEGWPWAYKVIQDFELSDHCLKITLSLTNTSDRAQPCSLGHHPYFLSKDWDGTDLKCRLQTTLEEAYDIDEDLIPIGRGKTPPHMDFSQGRLIEESRGLDNSFKGWVGRKGIVSWDTRDFKVIVRGEDVHNHIVIYTPEGENFFCFEPVTAATNSIYDEAKFGDTDAKVLEAGETFTTQTWFDIEAA